MRQQSKLRRIRVQECRTCASQMSSFHRLPIDAYCHRKICQSKSSDECSGGKYDKGTTQYSSILEKAASAT